MIKLKNLIVETKKITSNFRIGGQGNFLEFTDSSGKKYDYKLKPSEYTKWSKYNDESRKLGDVYGQSFANKAKARKKTEPTGFEKYLSQGGRDWD